MLIRDAATIWTGMPATPRLDGASLRIEHGAIAAIGRLEPLPGEQVLDARGCVVAPGWVNTHHHFFQSLLKAVPAGLHVPLAQWSPAVAAPFRGRFDAETFRTAVQLALCELVRGGCTTAADHQFLAYPGIGFDAAAILFEEAERFGVRLVLCRGGMTVAPAPGALPPWLRPESLDDFVRDVEALAARFHDPAPHARRRVAVAPTTLQRVRRDDLAPLAEAARALGLRLHSHLNETAGDNAWCRARHGCSAVELCEATGWLGPDVWFAHVVHATGGEIELLARTGTGVAHCPASNARLGSGIAPVAAMRQAGVRLSLAVDGAGSNESADMLSELHFAWLLHQTQRPAFEARGQAAPTVADAIGWASAGGADVLGLDTGRLEPGAPADLGVYALDDLAHLGAHDPASALVASAGRPTLRLLLCGGEPIVADGVPRGIDTDRLRARVAAAVRRIMPNIA
ncbi:8-oxoguanine deaminase [Pigmentiphaga soli]|uniref:8-oxoguanine deaminase n=1 Tax=Pigmentiphaga soli TaxID=1007095 RepID=A0ABP8HDJ2_9BURK